MSRFLLDTSIVSNIFKPSPSELLMKWIAAQEDESLFIASITVAELWNAIQESPATKKRKRIERWFAGPDGLQALFAGRILAFDEKAAMIWGRLMAEDRKAGHSHSAFDRMIASVAVAHDCTVITCNEKEFAGVKCINPTHAHK
jgi:toxin FitB